LQSFYQTGQGTFYIYIFLSLFGAVGSTFEEAFRKKEKEEKVIFLENIDLILLNDNSAFEFFLLSQNSLILFFLSS
jgi:hypothetical protein